MKIKRRRILSLLLAICLLFSFAAPFSAAAAGDDDEIVANMYLCHTRTQGSLFGHCWVYIENLSAETLQIGAYLCPPGQGVSAGTWALTRDDGHGIYYNLESYLVNAFGLGRMRAIKDTLTRAELEKVSRRAAKQNFWDFLFFNCAFYAAAVWNAGSGKKVIPLIHPTVVWLQIMLRGDIGRVQMYYPAREQVLRQSGSGGSASTYVVSDGTVGKRM